MGPLLLVATFVATLATITTTAATAAAKGDPERGAQAFRACASCHSLEEDRHMTGPSLAGLWGRQAGNAGGFPRYSPALEASGVVWTAETLDPWLADPQAFIPGNRMTFPGIENEQVRADLIAFLEAATDTTGATAQTGEPAMPMPGMGSGDMPDLERLDPANLVAHILYCGDTRTYRVATEAGETLPFWEFNLRFKTDSSDLGPAPGRPALLPSGMGGDRAFVIFAAPEEISRFIEHGC